MKNYILSIALLIIASSLDAQSHSDPAYLDFFGFSANLNFGRSTKTKQQLLIIYKSGNYAFYENIFTKKVRFDSGTLSFLRYSKKIKCHSIMVHNAFNPFNEIASKLVDGTLMMKKSGQIFLSQTNAETLDLINQFNDNKFYELKNDESLKIIEKNGFFVNYDSGNTQFTQKIKTPNNKFYQLGQRFSDSIFLHNNKLMLDNDFKEVYKLGKEIVGTEKTDSLKLILLSNWMVTHFEYDLKGPVNPQELLTVRKTRCEGYANFFHELCRGTGIPSFKVIGSGDNGLTPRYNSNTISMKHAWNMVKVNGVWRPIDVTWLDPTMPIGYEQKSSVKGSEFYFNPDLKRFAFDHNPEQYELKLTNLGSNSEKEFTESPVLQQTGYSVQYLGNNTNLIYTENKVLEFIFYSEIVQNINYLSANKSSQIEIELKGGINKIKVKVPKIGGEIKFENSDIKTVFYINPGIKNVKIIQNQENKSNESGFLYEKDFYNFIKEVLATSQFYFKDGLDSADKDIVQWNRILKNYQGRPPVGQWYNFNKDPVKMHFFFTDQLINGKKPIVECEVKCERNQIKLINPEHYPTSHWCFSLER